MPISHDLQQALRAWMHVFMEHTMTDFARYVRETGISPQQFGMLLLLSRNAKSGVSDIGDKLGVTHAAASQMAERLVLQGLLERTEDPQDRRARHLGLTVKGKELVEKSVAARRGWLEKINRELTPEQRDQIAAALGLLVEAARRADAESGFRKPG